MLLTKDYQNVANYTWNVTSNQKVIFYLDAKIGDYDISNNRTPIYTRLRSTINITPAGGSGYKFTCSYAPTIEGSAVWYFGNETITETNTTEYVYHNEDGTANVTLTSSVYNGYLGLNQTFSGTATLPTIPRKSSVTATSTTIGGACSININQKSDTFTHTLRYSFGNLNGTITTGVKYSYGWTVPNDFYSQIPNTPSGTATIYCDTYNGGTLIGTTSTTTIFNANENETKPSVSMSAKDINPITSQLTSGANESTKIVKGFSNVQITWSSTPKQYASIKSNAINGTSVSESPYTFYNANTNIFTFVATDTRGFKNSISTTNTSNPLIDYIPLQINPNFYRKAPTTGEVMLEFTGNYFNNKFGENGVNNELHIGYKYREKGSETSWSDIEENIITSDLYNINNNIINSNSPISLGTIYDYKKSYEFILLFKDKIIDDFRSKIVSKGKPIFWWDENGVYDSDGNKLGSNGSDTGWIFTSLIKDELGSRGNIMSGGAIYGRKIGNMVELNFATRLQGTGTTGDYTICTLKDAFKPTQNIYVQLLYGVQSNDVNNATIIKISTNGEITLNGFSLKSGIDNANYEYYLQGNVMYFV